MRLLGGGLGGGRGRWVEVRKILTTVKTYFVFHW